MTISASYHGSDGYRVRIDGNDMTDEHWETLEDATVDAEAVMADGHNAEIIDHETGESVAKYEADVYGGAR